MPVGWFFNYCNIFADPLERSQSPPKKVSSPLPNPKANRPSKSNPNNSNTKKQWNGTIFTKIIKKYEELNSKPIEEPKEGDPEEAKMDFIKAKNFQARIRIYLREINQLM